MERVPKDIKDIEAYFKAIDLDVEVDIIDIKHKSGSDMTQFGFTPEETFNITIKAVGYHKKKEVENDNISI